MGERKGQNFYYPPDFNYKTHKSLNKYHGTHALRERAAKIGQGILIIRFEMPFNVWCLGCHNHVGMGVRYNAEKKKVGMYYTTPLYEFRMKCHLCDNYYVIRTDPKNFDYELVEGLSRQEKRYDPSTIDQLGAVDRTFNQKLAADAMFKAEHEHTDKSKAETDEDRMETIEWVQERLRDDFAANQALRNSFRKGKKELTEKRARDSDLLARSSLQIKLAPEDANDKVVASMITRYRTVKSFDEKTKEEREKINTRRIFLDSQPSTSSSSASTSSVDRLKNNVKESRAKRILEEFEAPPSKKTALSLGIIRKVKKESEDGDSIDMRPINNDVDVKDEMDEKPANPLGLIANYSSSSDSE